MSIDMGMDNKPVEKNLIDNNGVKENLANAALGMLVKGEDFDKLVGATCQFGYLFDIEDHGLEALFKITTDKTTAYFVAHVDKLIRLNFNEERFKEVTERFLSMHS